MASVVDALSLARQGLRIHPLRTNSKIAIVPDWPERATTDQEQIKAWWTTYPDANIGVLCGDGLVVVDADGMLGAQSVELKAEATTDTRPTFTVKTPHGFHLYYLSPVPVRNSVSRLAPGLDVRGERGYVVGPGSSIDGTTYKVDRALAMAPAPKWLTEPPPLPEGPSPLSHQDAGPIPVGQQDDTLFRIASRWRARGLSYDGILAEIRGIPLERDSTRPPYTEADYQRIARSAAQYPAGDPPATFQHSPESQPLGRVAAEAEELEPVDGGVRIFTIAEARERNQESIEYLQVLGMDGYVVKGWTHLLAGWWRLGKSELMMACVMPWLRAGLRVIWVTEEPDSIWADRADAADANYADIPWENLTLIDAMSGKPSELLATVDALDSDVVIADTIREVCGVLSMKDDDEIRRAVSPWVRKLRGRTVIFIAQHRKAAGEHGERVEGSVALPSMMDVVIELVRVPGHDRRRKLSVRRRRAVVDDLTVEMDEDERMTVVPDGRSLTRMETDAAVGYAVNESDVPLTTKQVTQRVNGPTREAVTRALERLARMHRIDRDPPISQTASGRTVTWARRA